MKNRYNALILAMAFLLLAGYAGAQVSVTGSVGADGTYASLTAAGGAFSAINSSGQAGQIISISITADALAETGANALNDGGWTSLTISPSGGAARTVSGTFIGHLIALNGADNVTVDGLNTGGNSLTIINLAVGASSVIRFAADASGNTVTNCTLLGSTTASFGVISFGTGTATGNDGNSITNNNIGPSASGNPLNGIHSLGSSAAIDNSGNTVSGNNIYDYFSAGSSTSGINVNSFNSGWTISGNKFYQTANRTYTSSNTHYGIQITSGSGYTIHDNVIGYANSSGTGTTNMIGLTSGSLGGTFPSLYTSGGTANATRYVGINCTFAVAGAPSSIQNNTVAGFALYTSSGASSNNGIICGIAVNSGNANIGTAAGNNINNLYAATTTSGGLIAGIYASTSNTISIQNNSIHTLDAMGTTSANSGSINGINSAGTNGSFTISNNTIGNTTNPNLRAGNLTTGGSLSNVGTTFSPATGISNLRGILNSANGVISITQNTVRNAYQNSTSASSFIRGIEQTSSSTTTGSSSITNNTIQNFGTVSSNSSLSTFTNFMAGVGILLNGSMANVNISQNTISNLSLDNTTTSGTNLAGIAVGQANNPGISRNLIFGLSNASTSTNILTPGSVSGVLIRSGNSTASPVNVFNNMISLGTSQATNTCFAGVWANCGQTPDPSVTNVYYNSIHITGTVTSGSVPSFGFLRGDLSTTARTASVDVRNNIFNNERTGGAGNHYAISNNYGAAASATGWGPGASNFNVLNSASSSTAGYWTTDRTFASWQAVSLSDAVSLSGVAVTFVNPAAGDLHLNFGLTPTQLESAGTAITGYTTDIDNQTRPGPAGSVNGGATNPDLGADEFDGVPLDLTKPSITYTPLSLSSCLISRTLTASITDNSGINVSPGTKPRVYYKKSTNANVLPPTNDNTTDGWKYTEATNNSSPFSFTIDYSITFGGVASGDVIEYFVIAQDLAATPNVNDNVAIFSSAPTSVALVSGNFPVTGTNSYNLTTGLAGTVTIGASGTYASITGTGGLFEAINANGIDGSLIAEILDAGITETGAVSLNQIQQGCTPSSSLVIRPATGVTTLLSGSSATPLIDLNNADFVTIDGSNNGSSSKDMTIRNTGTGATIRFINGASNDTLRNCIVESQNATTNSGTVWFGTAAALGTTSGNSNNVISGCDVRDRSDVTGLPANAVYSEGTNSFPNAGNKISGCNIFNFTSNGVLVSAAGAGDGWTINPSSFYQTSARTTNITFIAILGGNGHSIVNNYMGGTAPNAGGSYLSCNSTVNGIDLNTGSASVTNVQGNIIKNIRTVGINNTMINVKNGSSLVNIGNITGNQIGSADTTERIEVGGAGLTSSVGIAYRSSSPVIISNNTLNNLWVSTVSTGAGLVGIYGESTSSGQCTVENNTVTNLRNSSRGGSPLLEGPSNTQGMSIFIAGANLVRGNTISNIGNVSTTFGSSPINVIGMVLLKSLAGTVIEKNLITNLYGSSSGTSTLADNVQGFQTGQNAFGTFVNNVISIDGGSPSDRSIIGISEQGGNTGAMNYLYNSVNIYGTSTGSNNTSAFTRNLSFRTNVFLRNNVFRNARVAAGGSNYAISNEVTAPNTAIGWPADASNYNALYSLNSNTVGRWGTAILNFSVFQDSSNSESYSLNGDPVFTSNTNLLPVGSDVNNWILKGTGIALSNIPADILGTPRSTTVIDGGTDIGAYEFFSSVQPPVYNQSTPSAGIYRFIHKQDTVARINVTTLGTLADINVQYYSGEDPPGLAGDPTVTDGFGNVYWEIHPTNPASGFTYDVTLHYSPALLGNIVNEASIKVAKNTDADTLYVPYTVQGTGPGEYQLDTVNNNITVYGLSVFSRYILTDGSAPLPVELSSFTSAVERRDVKLNWTTSSETNNASFEIERRSSTDEWTKLGTVAGSGTTNTPKNYAYTDKNLETGKYNYRLKQIDVNGNFEYFELGSEVNIGAPVKFDLSQNYPNPFNPSTKINYDIPVDSKVSIKLFDISGREVATLVNEIKTAGYYTLSFNGVNLASGMYFYRIVAEGNGSGFSETKKMTLIK
ncbi:MAG: hypothetical protein K1X85_06515 [Ignavibacteria bacterium]|nr:hypothetical protein [Ignavibacteria bacterium]